MLKLLMVVALIAVAMPAAAHCGPDGGIHDHLDAVLYLIASASVSFSIWKYKVQAWFKK